MPTLKVYDLKPIGSELLIDSETYLNEVGETEFENIYGGSSPLCASLIASQTARLAQQSSKRCAETVSYVVSAISGAISSIFD